MTHAVVGYTMAKMLDLKNLPKRFWLLSAILPVLPDADSIGFMIGIPYWHILGHRGFFHSIFFAFILAAVVMLLFFWVKKYFHLGGMLCLFSFLFSASQVS